MSILCAFEFIFWVFAVLSATLMYVLRTLEHKERVLDCAHARYGAKLTDLAVGCTVFTVAVGISPMMEGLYSDPILYIVALALSIAVFPCTMISAEYLRSYSVTKSLDTLIEKYGPFDETLIDKLYEELMDNNFEKFPFKLIEEMPFLVDGVKTPSINRQVVIRIEEDFLAPLCRAEAVKDRLLAAKEEYHRLSQKVRLMKVENGARIYGIPQVIDFFTDIAKWCLLESPPKEKPVDVRDNLVKDRYPGSRECKCKS